MNILKCFLKVLSVFAFTIAAFLLSVSSTTAIAADEKKKITSIEEANTPDEITAFAYGLIWQAPKELDAQLKHIRQSARIWLDGGDKILKITDDETKKIAGLKLKLGAYRHYIYADSIDPQKKNNNTNTKSEYRIASDKLLEEIEKTGKYPLLVNDEYYEKFSREDFTELAENFSLDKFNQYFARAKKLSVAKPVSYKQIDPLRKTIDIAMSANAVRVEPQLANQTIKDVIAFIKSEQITLPDDAKKTATDQLEKYSLRVVGVSPEIYGKTVDDKDFDWAALRGKYVLVKFTASWCGPCKREIAGMKTAYEKYHDKGFEIVSIYIWGALPETKKVVEEEKLSWLLISADLSEKAGLPPIDKKFAIASVPTMFLVDKDGKIILTQARGEDLQKKLAEIFGEK
ncbi:MAG: TlpA family protein disulfide reductase [Planctomycetaceae bacterium]|jgi:thiol-disulfide isomerase/thioredoxin|nr:TlpA family protein disulfide reductase [Planctomycetaceae bacterium]